MKRNLVILILLMSASFCFASGWGDYSLDIGDGYNVNRCNSVDVGISKANGKLILYPDKYDNVGPVVQYITTSNYILTKNLGRRPRNAFSGDIFQDIDPSKEFFFIIIKGTDEVIGPLSESEFSKRTEIASLGLLDWRIPKNPSFLFSLYVYLFLMPIAVAILSINFFWITIPVIITIILLLRRHVRIKQKENLPPK